MIDFPVLANLDKFHNAQKHSVSGTPEISQISVVNEIRYYGNTDFHVRH